ncbi:MAG: MBL fold metallo-hydrolase [Thermodesulfobacteriota bacterium]|jgi:glyoxylase-like metal-dependent hydrolase (beta-lactamase superfamily II)
MSYPNDIPNQTIVSQKEDPYKVISEPVGTGDAELTCFFFHQGANFYVFSYKNAGIRRHTFIDTGDPRYQDRMLSILTKHKINPEHIERIIITHRHYDHCGLADLLSGKSGAMVMVHANFRDFIEGPVSEADRIWLGGFEPSRLRKCRIEYLSPSEENGPELIDGLDFLRLTDWIPIGDSGGLEILACPESTTMHSPDQIIVHYRPNHFQGQDRPASHFLFSGDLWLMHGPLFSKGFREFSLRLRMASMQAKGILSGRKLPRRDPRLQDIQAKEALKHGFCLIRVMPGHGEDFIGTRMIPLCFLCDRDLLVELGYTMDDKKAVLKSDNLVEKIKTIRENAYAGFLKELLMWQEVGYCTMEMSDLLTRIYQEQKGGGPLVQEDRRERRLRIKETLDRLRDEGTNADGFRELAESTLLKLENI